MAERESPAEMLSQPSMAAGEIGPELQGRVDQELYYIGMRTVLNFIIRQYGGAANRPGTELICEAKYPDKELALIEFEYNEEQAYVVQAGDQYMRFIMNGGEIIEDPIDIGAITAGPTTISTLAPHGLSDGDDVFIEGILGMVEMNGRTVRVSASGADYFQPTDYYGNLIDISGYTAYQSGGTLSRVYEISSPYDEADLFDLNYTQKNDVLTITHKDYPPYDLTRTAHSSWTLSPFANTEGPFLDENVTETTVYASFATSNVSGAANNGTGLIRLTVASTANMSTGDTTTVAGVTGTTEANGDWTITVISSTTLDLQGSAFVNAYVSGGTVTIKNEAGNTVVLTASSALFDVTMVNEFFRLEQEPSDATKAWEALRLITSLEKRRAGTHYYQAEVITGVATISAISVAARGIVTANGHGFATGNYVFIENVAGMTEINGDFYYVKVIDANRFYPMDKDNSSVYLNTSSFTAYTSGGTASRGKKTGSYRPDWTEGSRVDGDPGVQWTYLHSGFGLVQIDTYNSSTSVKATLRNRLPDNVIDVANATTIWNKAAWSTAQGYPTTSCHFNRRQIFGGTRASPRRIDASKQNARFDFSSGNPVLDDEAFSIELDANGANAIRHLLPLTALIAFTSTAESKIEGDEKALQASKPPGNFPQQYVGSSLVRPLVIGKYAIHVQRLGGTVHSLKFEFTDDAFGGIDLTARSPHLFKNKAVKDWAYARHPYSVVWTIMDDGGDLLGFTYMEEQKVYAWHRHFTVNGTFEAVATIPEGKETPAYFVVQRELDGLPRRYIERLHTRNFADDIRDAFFVDAGLTYDGRNYGSTTIEVTGGTLWTSDAAETLTLVAVGPGAAMFTTTDATLGNQIAFWYQDETGADIRLPFEILSWVSAGEVTARALRDVPAAYRDTPRTDWEFAKRRFWNLGHLEGQDVACLADGNVIRDLSVENGSVTIIDPSAVVHIGYPITAQLETLDMSQPQGQTKARTLAVPRVFLTVEETRSVWIGNNGDGRLVSYAARSSFAGYDKAIPAHTGLIEVVTNTEWSRTGRIFIQQTDPLPVTINCITAEVELGEA